MPYKNPEDKKAWAKRYGIANRDKINEWNRIWRSENREKYLELQRKHQFAYRAKHRTLKIAPDYSDGLKYCQDCKVKRPLTEFSLVRRKKKYYFQENYYHLCNKCKCKRWREYALKGDYSKTHRIYMDQNKEKFKEYKRNYYLKNQEKIKANTKRRYVKKERRKANPKPLLETRWYLKKTKLLNNSNLEPEDIPKELMEAYKIYLQLKREVRNVNKNSI